MRSDRHRRRAVRARAAGARPGRPCSSSAVPPVDGARTRARPRGLCRSRRRRSASRRPGRSRTTPPPGRRSHYETSTFVTAERPVVDDRVNREVVDEEGDERRCRPAITTASSASVLDLQEKGRPGGRPFSSFGSRAGDAPALPSGARRRGRRGRSPPRGRSSSRRPRRGVLRPLDELLGSDDLAVLVLRDELEADAAARLVDLLHEHVQHVAAGHHVLDVTDPARADVRDVEQAVGALLQLDERAELGRLDDLAGVLVADLGLLREGLDRRDRGVRLRRRRSRR